MKGSAPPVVDVRGVRVLFGGVAALDGVDLQVLNGEVFVLVGPNGSGKTTLLNAVSGLVTVDGGSISVAGTEVTRRRPHQRARLGLGRTFQNPRVLPSITVHDVLSFGLYQHDRRTWTRAVFRPLSTMAVSRRVATTFREMLDRAGLPGSLLGAELRSLSHGQLKMVDLARAMLGRPRVLLMDEPTSGLNEEEIDRLHNIVRRLRDEGCTPVLVEHNVQFVLDLADRVAVLHRGKVLALGEPHSTLGRDEVVEAYLGPKGRRGEAPGRRTTETIGKGTDRGITL